MSGGGGRGERWRGGERERTSGLSQSVRGFFALRIVFHVTMLRRRIGTEKNTLLLLLCMHTHTDTDAHTWAYSHTRACIHACVCVHCPCTVVVIPQFEFKVCSMKESSHLWETLCNFTTVWEIGLPVQNIRRSLQG